MTQTMDGGAELKLKSTLLKEGICIVDTPGTNAIIERQQLLTEDYIPRANLVLFVLSADRPLTQSEVDFLKYIKRWGKKVVFVLNKADLIESEAELQVIVFFF